MFEDQSLGPEVLANPGMLQYTVLTELDNRLNGTYSIADPNNGFNQMLEIGSSMVAQVAGWMETNFETQYEVRASTSAELYPHMSDFDYLQLTYEPASTSLKFLLSKQFILDSAVRFNSSYNKLVIPMDTIFSIGSYVYGIYYPIEIRVNSITGGLTCVYDTSTMNPLFELTTNLVELTEWTFNGLEVVTITIPVYQFSQLSNTYDTNSSQGFSQTINYSDNLYAIRAFTNNVSDTTWTEMNWTLSEVYDTTAPTVASIKLSLQMENNLFIATVPQIYFTLGMIGNKIMIVVYTTKGAINITLSDADIQSCNITFQPNSVNWSSYAAPLTRMSVTGLAPVDTQIVGGSNGLTFAQLRQRIITNSMNTQVPIGPSQLLAYGSNHGFTITKYLDNITGRIYYASCQLAGGANGAVPVTVANVKLDNQALSGTSSVKIFTDNMMTVFPTTVYMLDSTETLGIPLTDQQMKYMASLDNDQLCTEMNGTTYTQYPYHVVVYTDGQYPLAKSFNLMNPTSNQISFVEENVNSASQMTLVNASITHQNNGSGGYLLQLAVNKTSDVQAIDEQYIYVILSTADQAAAQVIVRATRQGAAPTGVAYTDVYQVAIPTTYHITQDGYLETLLYTDLNTTVDCSIQLTTTFDVLFLIDPLALTNPIQDSNIANLVPVGLQSNIGLTHQTLTVVLGTDLSPGIYNILDAVYSAQTYMTYPENIYMKYTSDVYARDANGGLVYTVTNGQLVATKLHSAGDLVLDTSGNQVIEHAAGSTMLDPLGNPIIAAQRHIVYYVQVMQFDSRLYQSQNKTDQAYAAQLTSEIAGYTDTVIGMVPQLIEQTDLYFLPVSTIGSALFDLGNNKTATYPLGLSFAFNVSVTEGVYNDDNLMAVINAQIIAQVNAAVFNPVISMSDIIQICKENLTGDILGLDSLGINGMPTLQTLRCMTPGAIPTVAQILVNNPDGSLSLQQNITINPIMIGSSS